MKQFLATIITFWIGYAMCYFTRTEQMYNKGFEAGEKEPKAMLDIQKYYGNENMDSAIAKSKRMRSDSLNAVIFDLYTTPEEKKIILNCLSKIIVKCKEMKE